MRATRGLVFLFPATGRGEIVCSIPYDVFHMSDGVSSSDGKTSLASCSGFVSLCEIDNGGWWHRR